MKVVLRRARIKDLDALIPLIGAYHQLEGIKQSTTVRKRVVGTLLEGTVGGIWFVSVDGQRAGYVALCFGYSIELGGRDAFVDELYLEGPFRGLGIGQSVLSLLAHEARKRGIKVLHLEVSRSNRAAQSLYRKVGFRPRRFLLMSRHVRP